MYDASLIDRETSSILILPSEEVFTYLSVIASYPESDSFHYLPVPQTIAFTEDLIPMLSIVTGIMPTESLPTSTYHSTYNSSLTSSESPSPSYDSGLVYATAASISPSTSLGLQSSTHVSSVSSPKYSYSRHESAHAVQHPSLVQSQIKEDSVTPPLITVHSDIINGTSFSAPSHLSASFIVEIETKMRSRGKSQCPHALAIFGGLIGFQKQL
jgi:hypothetical protein